MSGHSKWSQIKHQKGLADAKKGQLFSKLSKLISIAAKKGADPSANTGLANAIAQARAANMPKENIERAIKRAGEKDSQNLQEMTIQALAAGNVGLVIEAITENRNRTLGEVKNILAKHNAKMIGEGALNYLFDVTTSPQGRQWKAKYLTPVNAAEREALNTLFSELEDYEDVQAVFSSIEHGEEPTL